MLFVENARSKAGKIVVLDLKLFRIKSFGAGNAVAVIVSLGEFGLLFAIPLFLQATRGYDALQTGVILLALALGSFVLLVLARACPNASDPYASCNWAWCSK
jgi:hypothetical protein